LDTSILVAIVSVFGSIAVAAMGYWLSQKQRLDEERRKLMVEHYRELLDAMSDSAIAKDKSGPAGRLARATHAIVLVASQPVISALMALMDFSSPRNRPLFTQEEYDRLLKELMLAIRSETGIKPADKPETFRFHLFSGSGL
jgi:hypothetical protein